MEMEERLTLEELYLLVDSLHRSEHRRNRFAAALKGVDLDEDKSDDKFEDVRRRAEAELAGKSEEAYSLDSIIEFEPDDD